GEIPPQGQLYWRGPVMVNFTGSTWSMQRQRRINQITLRGSSDPVAYTVILVPHGKHWLFGLDLPSELINNSFMSSEYQLISSKPVNDMKRYSLESRLEYFVGEDEKIDYLFKASDFPTHNNPRTIALGESWSRQFETDIEIVNHALSMFREQPFIYTLQPPLLGDNPSDEFLFSTRRGFCEHYASSLALLMRAAGIPARIVTGYQGGEINELGNYLIVRQSDAHAWTEVWLEGRGWVRIDPTAAVSPDRIENGLGRALEDTESYKYGERNPLLGRLLYRWDNLQFAWTNWVLNYDNRKQAQFLNQLGLGIEDWGDMIIALVVAISAITGFYWLVSWYRERPPPPPVYEKIIQQLLKKLARKGYQRKPSEHVFEFLDRIQRQQDFDDPALRQIFSIYSKIKYARGYQKQTIIRRLQQMVADWNVNTAGKPL
ncbi:MAG: DUF3488 and transglutaminase-like domain-containing protein, partial [Gammaproteobacteria bacterium]|nr:DUF3488 and transglutaminase-like domain-containing protein [Gammaproteobacteria bacterium]